MISFRFESERGILIHTRAESACSIGTPTKAEGVRQRLCDFLFFRYRDCLRRLSRLQLHLLRLRFGFVVPDYELFEDAPAVAARHSARARVADPHAALQQLQVEQDGFGARETRTRTS